MLLVGLLGLCPLGFSLIKKQSLQNLHRCYERLGKGVGCALEMYASDNQGQYPLDLQVLIEQHYLQSIPTCPAARTVTYAAGYRRANGTYTLSCQGNHHWLAGKILGVKSAADSPYYSSKEGMCIRE